MAESAANRRAGLLNRIDQLLEWVEMQYNFLDIDMANIFNDVIIPKYSKKINSMTNHVEKQKYENNIKGIFTFFFKMRGNTINTGLNEHIGYEQLRIDLRNLRQELLGDQDINRVETTLRALEERWDMLNVQFNKFIKDINRSIPGVIPRRFLSEHTPLPYEAQNFTFSTLTEKRNIPTNRTRNRDRNRSNGTYNARSSLRSAMRNRNRSRSPNRPHRGSIRIHETAKGPTTFHKLNIIDIVDPKDPLKIIEPGMTHTSKEIKNMSRKGSINLSRIYGSTSIYRNKLRRWMGHADTSGMTDEAANVARKEARETAAMVRHMTGEAANVATEAAIAANAAAVEARRIVSTVSERSPIFGEIQFAANEASRAAQRAVELAQFAQESFSIAAAQGTRDDAIKAHSIAVRALEEIRERIRSSPAAAAAASSR